MDAAAAPGHRARWCRRQRSALHRGVMAHSRRTLGGSGAPPGRRLKLCRAVAAAPALQRGSEVTLQSPASSSLSPLNPRAAAASRWRGGRRRRHSRRPPHRRPPQASATPRQGSGEALHPTARPTGPSGRVLAQGARIWRRNGKMRWQRHRRRLGRFRLRPRTGRRSHQALAMRMQTVRAMVMQPFYWSLWRVCRAMLAAAGVAPTVPTGRKTSSHCRPSHPHALVPRLPPRPQPVPATSSSAAANDGGRLKRRRGCLCRRHRGRCRRPNGWLTRQRRCGWCGAPLWRMWGICAVRMPPQRIDGCAHPGGGILRHRSWPPAPPPAPTSPTCCYHGSRIGSPSQHPPYAT